MFEGQPVGVLVTGIAIGAVGLGSIPELVELDTVLPTAHCRCDKSSGPSRRFARYALAQCRKYNEELISFLIVVVRAGIFPAINELVIPEAFAGCDSVVRKNFFALSHMIKFHRTMF